jgi:RNA polymerase sigma-70 factor (ECF subfamily)
MRRECVNWPRDVLSSGSPDTHRAKVHGLSDCSDSILSSLPWPLTGRAQADSGSASSPEIVVVELFDELRDRMLRYLLALGLCTYDGEEIVQESFLLLFLHLRSGRPRQNLRGWIFRVARNLALKQRAARQLQMRRIVEIDATLHEPQADRNSNPEEELEGRLRQQRLLAVVNALPEQDQSCLCLRAEGLRYREIATTLGISLGSVAASLARSLARLSRADGV